MNFLLFFLLTIYQPPSGPVWKPFNEASRIAAEEQKKMLVYFYADWCTYCRAMDRETFSDQRVLQLLLKQFVVTRINVESDEFLTFQGRQITHRQFARMLRASSLPTSSFLDEKAAPITYLPGKPDTDTYIDLLAFVGSNAYKTSDFEAFLKKKQSN